MKPSTEQSLGILFTKNNDQLHHLVRKTQQLNELTALLHQFLEPILAEHCQVANFRDQTLIIAIDNSIWATQLRYRIPNLIRSLQQEPLLRSLKTIEWYVQPPLATQPRLISNISLSAANGNLLAETADNAPTDKLRAALLRLAKHAK